MKLNHLDLQVSDIGRAREFFETFFNLRCTYQRAGQIALLEDESGFSLAVSNLRNSPPPIYPPDFHIGFILEKADAVRTMYERLKSAGVPIKFDLASGGANLYFMCLAPDAISVEVRAPDDNAQ